MMPFSERHLWHVGYGEASQHKGSGCLTQQGQEASMLYCQYAYPVKRDRRTRDRPKIRGSCRHSNHRIWIDETLKSVA